MKKRANYSIVKPEKFPFYYGFVILVMSTLGMFASIPGQTVGVSTFTDPVKDALMLTRDQFSWAYTAGTVISSLLLGYAGRLYDKVGARWIALGAALGLSLALLLASFSFHMTEGLQSLFNMQHWTIPFVIMVLMFFLIRFFGQGVLTLASRNMLMNWYDKMRGRMNAISSVVVAFAFSISPLWINGLIEGEGWRMAWRIMALGLVVFAVLIWMFFRDKPEAHGLLPDGKVLDEKNKDAKLSKVFYEFSLVEAVRTRAFWMYSLMLSFNGFFITGLTFHVVSVFETAGFDKLKALSIFWPMSIVSVITSVLGNYLSDQIRLRFLLYAMIAGAFISCVGLYNLDLFWGYYAIVFGSGVSGGLFSVLATITWPRYFGRSHLGAISGKTMSMIVFASAIGPSLFSLIKTLTGSYAIVGLMSSVYLIAIAIFARKVRNPQLKLAEERTV